MILSAHAISKSFPGVRSLDRVDFALAAGEVRALVGENGAGKSTLIKIIAGAYSADEGEITFAGRAAAWSSPQEAKAAGIHVIYQELVLFPELTVAQNIFADEQPRVRLGLTDTRAMRARAAEVLASLGTGIDPDTRVGDLSVADQQMVEIARAMSSQARLLIFDEPTAVLGGREVEMLFGLVRRLKARGVAVVFISHRLDEVFEIADSVTVLKDGRLVGTRPVGELDHDRLVAMMIGRELADIYPPRPPRPAEAEVVIEARDIRAGDRVRDVSLEVRRGEILGLAGMVGAGRTELAHAIFGSLPLEGGTVRIGGRTLARPTPRQSIAAGVGFLTEDRKGEGLFMLLDLAANVSAPVLERVTRGPWLDRAAETRLAGEQIRLYGIAAPGPSASVATLSGGNQQKVLLGRWVASGRRALILDEPTRGVDVGAKIEIYRIIRALADEGVAILLISSELPEIIGLCDRVVVMREGRRTGELAGAAITEAAILQLAVGAAAMQDDGGRTAAAAARGGAAGGAGATRRAARLAALARRVPLSLAVVVALLAILVAVGAVLSDRFATTRNFLNVFQQAAGLGFVSLGQTLVILTGGIDLSVGAMISVASNFTSGLIDGHPERVAPVVAGVILMGAAIGGVNGALSHYLRLHPLIVTLGMAAVLQGTTLLYALAPAGSVPSSFQALAYDRAFGMFSIGGLAMLALFAAVGLFLRRTRMGLAVYAVGGDARAARLLGIPVPKVLILVYALSGALAAFTGVYFVSRMGSGDPWRGEGLELASITPVVVGGTILAGGKGGVLGTLLGVYLIALLNNLLNFLDVSTFYQWIVQGLIIITAVVIHVDRRRRP